MAVGGVSQTARGPAQCEGSDSGVASAPDPFRVVWFFLLYPSSRRPIFAAASAKGSPWIASVSSPERTDGRGFEATLRDATLATTSLTCAVDVVALQAIRTGALGPAPLANHRVAAESPQRAARRSSVCSAPVVAPSLSFNLRGRVAWGPPATGSRSSSSSPPSSPPPSTAGPRRAHRAPSAVDGGARCPR